MYTGIVQAVRPLLNVTRYPGHNQFTIDLTPELLEELKIGASVSVEGTCLSVTEIDGSQVRFDAMTATLERTNLRFLSAGQGVNIERSAKMNAEVGGHLMAGHIACTAEIVELSIEETGAFIKFRMPPEWAKYVFARGFLGVNGCSLTVADVEDGVVTINLIPETLRQTTFARYQAGDLLNIEVDHQTMVLVDVVERTLKGTLARENLLR
ncbi:MULTISPECIES: riboflavin synthase subunit alpha [unclassified Pseudomonas]|uniref:riboflavin synthase subunit alpha n=1 Tax=unclassified Pseudomonas TaxID=196821 RepID=UPI0021BAF7C4|nr:MULTISPECIES: riboflavin synthase subunit alpha [unclassified Pseudomonas]MCT8165708.1 riboflavin synthase subunit alpha [Pseudomonas sp. HD6422]MCT8184700.1 riboflavin synthase subunit alpha [Pseudomonas sp. HD6421]